MKLRCSRGHEYDTEHFLNRGVVFEGDKCPMVRAYDRMSGVAYCRRILKEVEENG